MIRWNADDLSFMGTAGAVIAVMCGGRGVSFAGGVVEKGVEELSA